MSQSLFLPLQNKIFLNSSLKNVTQNQKIFNPYSGQLLGEIGLADSNDCLLAVDSIDYAFKETKNFPKWKKIETLDFILQKVKENFDNFVTIIILESGKPKKAAIREVNRVINVLEDFASYLKFYKDEMIDLSFLKIDEGKIGYIKRVALGPALFITPFNFPLNLAIHKIAPAIVCGIPFIWKPAPQTPFTAIYFASLLTDLLHYPKEAISILPTTNQNVEMMLKSEKIKLFSFTGSAKIGWYLSSIAGKKRVLLELGGNAGVVVDEDVDIEFATERIVYGGFLYSGQVCISVQRVYIHKNIYDEAVKKIIEKTLKLKVGDPMDEDVDVGPLISKEAVLRVDSWVKEAVDKGARVLCGGRYEGNIYHPTILEAPSPKTKIVCEEVFGPVLNIFKFDDIVEALKNVEDTAYGLQAGVFTNDISIIKKADAILNVGGLIINDVPTFRSDILPYGGMKDSGIGREGVFGAIEDFTAKKTVVLNII